MIPNHLQGLVGPLEYAREVVIVLDYGTCCDLRIGRLNAETTVLGRARWIGTILGPTTLAASAHIYLFNTQVTSEDMICGVPWANQRLGTVLQAMGHHPAHLAHQHLDVLSGPLLAEA